MNRREPSKNLIRLMIASFYGAGVLVHLLVVAQVIPYSWVNGGLSPSYEAQAIQSGVSIVVLGVLGMVVWGISKRTQLRTWQKRLLYALVAFWILGFVMQLLGTPFERYVMSVALFVGVISHVRLAQSRT